MSLIKSVYTFGAIISTSIIAVIAILLFADFVGAAQSENRADYYNQTLANGSVFFMTDGLCIANNGDITLNAGNITAGDALTAGGWTTAGLNDDYIGDSGYCGSKSILINTGSAQYTGVQDNAFNGIIQWTANCSSNLCSFGVYNYYDGTNRHGFDWDRTNLRAKDASGPLANCGALPLDGTPFNASLRYNRTGFLDFYYNNTLCHSKVVVDGDEHKFKNIVYQFGDTTPYEVLQFFVAKGGIPEAVPAPPPASNETVTFVSPTPANNSHNNTQVYLNMTATNNLTALWFGNSSTLTNADRIFINQSMGTNGSKNWLTNVTTEGTYYYKAAADSNSNTSLYTWVYDVSVPTITIRADNGFTSGNYSRANRYNRTLPFNLTIQDNIGLYGFLINITHSNGTSVFSYENTSLSGFSWNYTTNISLLGWANNTRYNILLQAADSHTATDIKDYRVRKSNSRIDFDTAEGNSIAIYSDQMASVDARKKRDRYEFDFNFVMAGKKPRTFHVTSENPIRYIPDSPYQGHFVVWNGHGGNWIDFEGTSDIPTITKVDDRHYTVSFSGIDDQATFRSIGGLNVRTENYTWYKGGYHMTIPAGLDQVNSTLTLNITYDSSIAGINASLVYNTTQNPITSRTIYSDYMIFNASVTAPTLTNNSNVSFYWAVNVTQNDANSYNFSLSGLHQVDAFLIDDCTLYSFKALNFTLKDEISTSYVSGDTTGVFNYSKSGIYKQYSLTATAKQSFGICLSTNTPLATAYSLAYSATSYPQRTYSEDSQTLSATQQNTTLWMLNTSYGIYTTFKVVDQFNNALKDVTAEMADTIGGVSQLIEGKMTDSAGVATFWADPDESYEFTFTKTGYTTQILSITPTDKDIYTVIMASETSSNLTNVDEGDLLLGAELK